MNKMIQKFVTLFFSISLLFLINGCAEDPDPSLLSLIAPSNETPELISLNPPDSALAGVTVIEINGKNFSDDPAKIIVYFNGTKGAIQSATPTKILVKVPIVISDTVNVVVAVQGAEMISNKLTIMLKPAVSEYYPFDAKKGEIPYSFTIDNQSNFYISNFDKGILKIEPNGTASEFAPPRSGLSKFNTITYGPNTILYATNFVKGIYQVEAGQQAKTFVAGSNGITESVVCTDFDINKNLWAGGKNNIFRVRLDKNVRAFPVNGTVNAIKVYQNYIFAAVTSNNKEIVLRIPFIGTDSLGVPEEYFNYSTQVDTASGIVAMAISQDGELYLGTSRSSDPVTVLKTNGSFETLYPGLINSSVYAMCWGTGNYLYISINDTPTQSRTIYKLDLLKPGATYYGRE
ncbi:MAG: IPT/TIG domain-containing protein [Ignavibacteriaceae bacterium]|nr:IPT/TIG domain-containing protein [Ignavibacteriaceae bacterium]